MGDPGDAKYGMTRPQLTEALLRLRDLGAVRFGLHAFLSSNTTDPAYYPALARLLFQTGRELMDESGMPLAFVNLSGGIGIPYRPISPKPISAPWARAWRASTAAPSPKTASAAWPSRPSWAAT